VNEKVIKKRRQKQLLLRVAAVARLALPGATLGQAQPEAIQVRCFQRWESWWPG